MKDKSFYIVLMNKIRVGLQKINESLNKCAIHWASHQHIKNIPLMYVYSDQSLEFDPFYLEKVSCSLVYQGVQ